MKENTKESKSDLAFNHKQNRMSKLISDCLNKKKFFRKTAERIVREGNIPMRCYHCPHCFAWHITIKENTKDKKFQNS